jgi:2-iminobutanoate/2-iminopropanoate deaminase
VSERRYAAAPGIVRRRAPEAFDPPTTFRVGVCERFEGATDAIRLPSDAVQVLTSGTPGLTPTGAIPDSFEAEARQAWRNMRRVLASAGAGLTHIVSVRTYLTDPDDIGTYTTVQQEFIGHEPASFLAVVHQLIRPGMRVQLEVIAAVPLAHGRATEPHPRAERAASSGRLPRHPDASERRVSHLPPPA